MIDKVTFEEMKSSHLLMIRWLSDKRSYMNYPEKIFFDFLIGQRVLNGNQGEHLKEIYEHVRAAHGKDMKMIYEIERFESCGMVG